MSETKEGGAGLTGWDGFTAGEVLHLRPEEVGLPPAPPGLPVTRVRCTHAGPDGFAFAVEADKPIDQETYERVKAEIGARTAALLGEGPYVPPVKFAVRAKPDSESPRQVFEALLDRWRVSCENESDLAVGDGYGNGWDVAEQRAFERDRREWLARYDAAVSRQRDREQSSAGT